MTDGLPAFFMTGAAVRRLATPAGELVLAARGGRLCLCCWTVSPRLGRVAASVDKLISAASDADDARVVDESAQWIGRYFAGEHPRPDEIEWTLVGTLFQQSVWQAVSRIPYGATATYGQVAAAIGRPSAVRAVAAAVGFNPLALFVPCHRVVGADGRLTGYAGSLTAKRLLLELEGRANGA